MSEKLSVSNNPANQEHLCAKQVVHEKWGKGDCIPTMHAEATEDGSVAWYDVVFEHGIEARVPVEDLEITVAESHTHSKKKKVQEKMDPVNKKAVKKDFEDRNDKDIDNDGDEDGSDKYLHMRRKAITKAINKEK